jgi:cell wall-associated NlpC family hydrolase
MSAPDPRTTPYRPDLAASHLRNIVQAAHYADGTIYQVVEATAPLRREPRHDAPLDTEALLGERITVYETDVEGWAWGQLERDGYVGFLPLSALVAASGAPTHKVIALRTLGFPGPDIKLPPVMALPFGASVEVLRGHGTPPGTLAATAGGYFVPMRHLAPLNDSEADIVAVAERFLNTPYLWGGKTSVGIDCSGLVQVSLQAAGLTCPRDSDMQEKALGEAVLPADLQRGDLIFWRGHVAIARDAGTIIHANAFHMAVAIEPMAEAVARIAATGSNVTSVKRIVRR